MEKINMEVLLRTAELGSFRKAAEEMGYTQAGIAYIVKTAEEELGIKVFDRHYGGVSLTSEGKQLMPWVREVVSAGRSFAERLNEIRELRGGEIRIVSFSAVSVNWLPPVLERFHRDYPKIKVEIASEENPVRGADVVMEKEADLGFFLLPADERLEIAYSYDEPLMVALGREHPLAGCDTFPIARLGDFPYAGPSEKDDRTGIFKRHGIIPEHEFVTENGYTALGLAEMNLSYCISPHMVVRNSAFNVAVKEFDVPQFLKIGIGVKNLETCSGAARKFIDYTVEWLEGGEDGEHTGKYRGY